MLSGILPIGPFPLSRLINSTYEEQPRRGLRHNLDLSLKKVGNPRLEPPPPPGLASPNRKALTMGMCHAAFVAGLSVKPTSGKAT